MHGRCSVLVWAFMSAGGAGGAGDVYIIDGILDHNNYIDILKSHLNPSVQKMGLPADYIFNHDSDPKHTAPKTKLYLLYNTPKWMVTPPQSPGINPTENL